MEPGIQGYATLPLPFPAFPPLFPFQPDVRKNDAPQIHFPFFHQGFKDH